MFSKLEFKIAFSLNMFGNWGADLVEDWLCADPLCDVARRGSPLGLHFLIGAAGQHQAGKEAEQAVLNRGHSRVGVGGGALRAQPTAEPFGLESIPHGDWGACELRVQGCQSGLDGIQVRWPLPSPLHQHRRPVTIGICY